MSTLRVFSLCCSLSPEKNPSLCLLVIGLAVAALEEGWETDWQSTSQGADFHSSHLTLEQASCFHVSKWSPVVSSKIEWSSVCVDLTISYSGIKQPNLLRLALNPTLQSV